MGAIYGTLPAGCITPSVQGTTYYLCGNTWFQPSYGANGVYYTGGAGSLTIMTHWITTKHEISPTLL